MRAQAGAQLALGWTEPPAPDRPPAKPPVYQTIVLETPIARAAVPVAPEPVAPVVREPVVYTVRQLIGELRQHIESGYAGLLLVEGEVSNCRPAASGHLYFTLKDGDAQLPVVMFRRQAQLLGLKIKDGMAVELRGRISVYETRGQLQLIAETLRARAAPGLCSLPSSSCATVFGAKVFSTVPGSRCRPTHTASASLRRPMALHCAT